MKKRAVIIFLCILLVASAVYIVAENSKSASIYDVVTESFSKIGVYDIIEIEGVVDDIISVRYGDDVDANVVASRLAALPEIDVVQTNNFYQPAISFPGDDQDTGGPNYEQGIVLIQLNR